MDKLIHFEKYMYYKLKKNWKRIIRIFLREFLNDICLIICIYADLLAKQFYVGGKIKARISFIS